MADNSNEKTYDSTSGGTKAGAKPVTGISTGTTPVIYQYDENGNVTGKRDFGGTGIQKSSMTIETNPSRARIGDYYYDGNGNLNVVPNSPTDIFNKWKLTDDKSLYAKPTRSQFSGNGLPLGAINTGVTTGLAAFKGASSALGAAGSAMMTGPLLAAISAVSYANEEMARERAYRDALKDWEKSQEKAIWKLAGKITIDKNGKAVFTPDYSKVSGTNTEFAGSEIQKAFGKETEVFFGDDGRLKININPVYANTDNYKDRLDVLTTYYSDLTKDSDNANEAIEEIKKYLESGNNQFKFRERTTFLYKSRFPEASEDAIETAYTNELGAYMSEKDGESFPVKVYRDGKIVDSTAKDVLDNVYNMDKGKRSDYLIELYSKLDDPNISDDDKVYILSEIRLLNAADDNEEKYDNGEKNSNGATVKTTNKYFNMLDQDQIITFMNKTGLTTIVNALNNITPWDMYTNPETALQEDPAMASAATLIGTAANAVASFMMMQGIEYGIVRPIAGKLSGVFSKGINRFLESVAARGGKLSEFIGNIQLTAGSIGDYLTSITEGTKLAISPFVHVLGYSMSELLYNATSDLIFDLGKMAVRAFGGEEVSGEEFMQEFSTDLMMDLLLQYGPAGMLSIRTEMDNYRLEQAYEPYAAKHSAAKDKYFETAEKYAKSEAELSHRRKGSKAYEQTAKELKANRRAYNKAKKEFEAIDKEVQDVLSEAVPTSEALGADIAGGMAKVDRTKIVMWIRHKLFNEKAAMDVIAEQAYSKTKDVYLYQMAINKFQSSVVVTKEVINKMNADFYTKGTRQAYQDWVNAVDVATGSRKNFSQKETNYMNAKYELNAWTQYAKGDQKLIDEAHKVYDPYINAIDGEKAKQLDKVIDTTIAYLEKVGNSYINSGAASEQEIKDIRTAQRGISYMPVWGKKKLIDLDSGGTETIEENRRNVGRTFDKEKGPYLDEDGANPVLSAMAYTNNIANNIARNDMASLLNRFAAMDGLDIKLVGDGAKGAKPEYQDIIDTAVDKMSKIQEKIIKNAVSQQDYEDGMAKFFGEDTTTKSMEELTNKQNKLRKAVEASNNETDPVKKAKLLARVAKLNGDVEAQRVKVRTDVDNKVRKAADYFNNTYKKYGITVKADDYLTSKRYTNAVEKAINSNAPESMAELKVVVDRAISKVAPYLPVKKIDAKAFEAQVAAVRAHTANRVKKEHPEYSEKKQQAIVIHTVESFKAQLTGDYSMVNADWTNPAKGVYKIDFISNGKDASFYIEGDLAKDVAAEMNSENVIDRRLFTTFLKEAANIKRLMTTGIDPTRVLPNLVRDTLRNAVFSGGADYWFYDKSPFGFIETFTRMAKATGVSDDDINKALGMLKIAQETARGSSFNEAVSGKRTFAIKRMKEASKDSGLNKGVRIFYDVKHGKRTALEAPMNWAEGFTRNRAAASAFIRAFMRGASAGVDVDTRIRNAYEAGLNAGRENTTNFARRGVYVSRLSSYVPYFSQKFSNIESAKISFLKDPIGVSTRLMMFGTAYMVELSNVLSREETRKNYYNLSEYDRENNVIFAIGDDLVTIPLDETLSALIYPWRRGVEMMHNVDPEDFYMIFINSFLKLSPFDLSGFTEGDSFNFGRGVEKLGAQMLPTLLQAGYTQLTGRSMYYGSEAEVTAETLADYGNYKPTMGDYTTTGNNSRHLRALADWFGTPQWRLQQMVTELGGNVGQYVVNILDRISGAPEDEQGGKDFIEATYKSFTGMDSEQVKYAFNDGIKQLKAEKEKLKGELAGINDKISLASGEKLVEYQNEYDKVKRDFATKVGNFVEKYINAYEIAGGLTKSQANQIYYLFNFSDDDSATMAKSVGAYYSELAKQEASDEAVKYSAEILDKYYDQNKNIYRDDDGTWHYYSPYGEQAFFNMVSGEGMKYQVGLRNVLEPKGNSLKSEHSAAYDARSAAADAGDWDTYDKLGLQFDEKVVERIYPYIKRYGADNVLNNTAVLEYLEDWFFVPSSYMKSKYGKNVSLAHNASKQRAFVRPYIKEVFGLSTAYSGSNYIERPERLIFKGEE